MAHYSVQNGLHVDDEPDKPRPHHHILFLIHFKIILSLTSNLASHIPSEFPVLSLYELLINSLRATFPTHPALTMMMVMIMKLIKLIE